MTRCHVTGPTTRYSALRRGWRLIYDGVGEREGQPCADCIATQHAFFPHHQHPHSTESTLLSFAMSSQSKEPSRNSFCGLVQEESTPSNPPSANPPSGNISVLNTERPSATSHISATSPVIGSGDERMTLASEIPHIFSVHSTLITPHFIASETGGQEILQSVSQPFSTFGVYSAQHFLFPIVNSSDVDPVTLLTPSVGMSSDSKIIILKKKRFNLSLKVDIPYCFSREPICE